MTLRLPPVSSLANGDISQYAISQGQPSPASHALGPTTPVYIPPLTPRTPSTSLPAALAARSSYSSASYPALEDPRKRTATTLETQESEAQVAIKREPSDGPDSHPPPDMPSEEVAQSDAPSSRNKKKRKAANASPGRSGNAKKRASHKLSPLQLAAPSTSQRTDQGNGSGSSHSGGGLPPEPSPVSPIVMGFDAASALQDPTKGPTVRKSLSLMEQQKALIEARKAQIQGAGASSSRQLTQQPPPQHQQQHNYTLRARDEEEPHDDASALSLADRRGEKARKLTIQTPASSSHDPTERAGGRTFSSIKSAPIRATGFQQAVQEARIKQLAAEANGAYPEPQSSQDGRPPAEPVGEPDFARPMGGPRPPHTAHDFTAHSYPPHLYSARIPSMRDRPAPPREADSDRDRQASKAAFLNLFDNFYESLSDSRVLQSNLQEQMRRATALLGTLQQSSSVFESLLDKRMAEMCQSLTNDLQVLEGRIERLERSFETNANQALPPLTPSLAGLPQRSFVTQQREHMDQLARRGSNASAATVADASAAVATRLERLEHLSSSDNSNKLSTHATSNLRGSG